MHAIRAMICLSMLACSSLYAAEITELPPFQEVRAQAKLGQSKVTYRAQSLGVMDHPLKDQFKFAGVTIRVKRLEKNEIEIDYGAKRPKKIKKTSVLKVNVPDPAKEGKTLKQYIEFKLDKEGQWTYRNKTVLALSIQGFSGALAVVDANGNGYFNDPYVDGIAWPKSQVLFPLPKETDAWAGPNVEIKGLSFGTLGQDVKATARVLSSSVENGVAVLQAANRERVQLGLTPRGEDVKLSKELTQHCNWMKQNKQLSHPEKKGTPGYTPEGHASGMRSILSSGRGPEQVAPGFMKTLYHRYDVIRADLKAFGVGSQGGYSGIDGRSSMMSAAPKSWWPILCPMPEQTAVPLNFELESPDPIKGDKEAGYPITVVFASNKTKLNGYHLKAVQGGALGPEIECYTYDASDRFVKFGNSVALIPKDPLSPGTVYQVMIDATVAGSPWKKTWMFKTR